jgi:hypothetical protein
MATHEAALPNPKWALRCWGRLCDGWRKVKEGGVRLVGNKLTGIHVIKSVSGKRSRGSHKFSSRNFNDDILLGAGCCEGRGVLPD